MATTELSDRALAALVQLATAALALLQLEAAQATTAEEADQAAQRATKAIADAMRTLPPAQWPQATLTLFAATFARLAEQQHSLRAAWPN